MSVDARGKEVDVERVVVVGGGVVGMLSARLLAEQGMCVEVLERIEAGQESSWAGGGIISPLYPWRYSPAVTALAEWSQTFYPRLGEALKLQVGLDPEVYTTGLYWLDLEDQSEALAWGQARGFAPVAMDEVYRRVKVLGQGFSKAIYNPALANVRNPRLAKALKAALQSSPHVTLHENTEVLGFVVEHGHVTGVRTANGIIKGDRVVLCAGAWSGRLLATLGLALPVMPVKGQMILYKAAPDYLSAMVMAQGRYAIPRKDGHILIGSTLEHAEFDKTPTDEALTSLQASAHTLLPGLKDMPVVKHWAGLRPGSPDGIPFIGELEEVKGLWLNCGHYRNGLVLAPASCQLLADLMAGQKPIIDPKPYAPGGRLHAV